MSSIERTTYLDATADEAWAVLADFGALAAWVPMIQHSCLLADRAAGIGAVRRVQIGRQTLVERVVTWQPPHVLSYTIEGLPPMVGAARNTWRITPTATGCNVTLTTEIDAGRNPVKRFVAGKVLERMSTASDFMLAGLAEAVTAATTTANVTATASATEDPR